jgi:hypothetical protein
MSFLSRIFGTAPTPSDAARALAVEGERQRRDKILAKTRQIREELGLPPHGALQ